MKEKIKNYLIISVLLILVSVIFYAILSEKEDSLSYEEEFKLEENLSVIEENNEESSYFIDIKGEVKNPGVYEISEGSRIIDVINIAGGLTKNADTSLLNLSKKVIDEMSIKIYSKKEVSNAKESVNKEPEVVEIIKEIEKECVCPEIEYTCDTKNDALIEEDKNNLINNKDENSEEINDDKASIVNINTATKEELMTITGVGEAKANAIIEYRKNNKFERIEDILNVSGIKDAMFETIKDYITV